MKRRAQSQAIVLAIVAVVIVAGAATYWIINQNGKGSGDSQPRYAGASNIQDQPKTKENTKEKTKKNTKENTKKQSSDTPPKAKPDPKKPIDHKTMMEDARAGKYDMKCTFHTADSSGVLYVHKKNMRSEAQTPAGKGYFIVLGHNAYTWLEGKSQGILFTNVGTSAKTKKYSFDEYEKNSKKYHLKCQKVNSLDASLFQVPQNVSFQDMNKMIGRTGR